MASDLNYLNYESTLPAVKAVYGRFLFLHAINKMLNTIICV